MKQILRFLLVALINIFFVSFSFAGELVVEVLNVGQADAILITAAGKTVLIDAGEAPTDVSTQLSNKGIRHLDLIVATHPHADHIGGMREVLANFSTGVYIDNGMPHTSSTYTKLMEYAESQVLAGKLRYMVASQGQRLKLGDEAYFDVLLPAAKTIEGTRSDINANSVILRLVHGDVCFLFMGDAEAETELALLDKIGPCQVLKASHHGSRHSSVDAFLDVVQAKDVLVTCGLANKHGHPGPEFLDRMQARNTRVHRTDLQGAIRVISNAKTYRIETDHSAITVNKININLAPEKVLMELPGIGKGTAQAIIEYREANGPFLSTQDVLKASPRQAKRLEKTLPFITVEGGSITGLTDAQAMPGNQATAVTPNMGMMEMDENDEAQVPAAAAQGRININLANAAQLAAMPGMSASKAEAAIQHRQANGPFKSCRAITDVKGIGVKTFEKLQSVCITE